MQDPVHPVSATPEDALPPELRALLLPPLPPERAERLRHRAVLLLAAAALVLAVLHVGGRLEVRPDRIVEGGAAWKAYAGTIRAERRFTTMAEACRELAAEADPERLPGAIDAPWNPYAGYLGASWHVQRWARRAGLGEVEMPPGSGAVSELSMEISRILDGSSRADLARALRDMGRLQEDAADWAVGIRAEICHAHRFLQDADPGEHDRAR